MCNATSHRVRLLIFYLKKMSTAYGLYLKNITITLLIYLESSGNLFEIELSLQEEFSL